MEIKDKIELGWNGVNIAQEDSHREHRCRPRVGDKIVVWEY